MREPAQKVILSLPLEASHGADAWSGGLGGRSNLDAVDQQNIDKLEGIIAFLHDDSPTALRDGNEIGVRHLDRAPVRQVKNKRLKRLVVQNLANRDGIHTANLEGEGLGVKCDLRALGAYKPCQRYLKFYGEPRGET
jgi:hypothetical protein